MDQDQIKQKLNAPKKLSLFERQRQEAETKRLRDEAENLKALREFENSFADEDDDDDEDDFTSSLGGGGNGGGGSRPRHHQQQQKQEMRKSGPGTLDLPPPPPSLKRKRQLEEERERERRGMRASEDIKSPEEPSVRRPTMLWSQLPKNFTARDIRRIAPANLKIEDVSFGAGRSAIVTISADTPMSDVDSCVAALQGKYLGFGCYLKTSRHVSGSATTASTLFQHDNRPFGAKPLVNGMMAVQVTPPTDLKLLKVVHKTVEQVIKYGPSFEHGLLSDPGVQQDERWAWIFDSNSQASVYYRWLIYEYHASQTKSPSSSAAQPENQFGLLKVFDKGPLWQAPQERLKFEFVFGFEDLTEDSGYVSSDDDDDDETDATRQPPITLEAPNTSSYLNPYRKAKLVYLLSRLPDTLGMLRAGDVARVTSFVVNNAGCGAEEIVSMLVENVERPYSRAVQYEHPMDDLDEADEDDYELIEKRNKNDEEKKKSDPSNAKLIALYLICDALQNSSTSGVRDAWKIRGLFETALRSRNIFGHLGRLEREHDWGLMRAEQWKRKVGVVLSLWEKWSVFSVDSLKSFRDSFLFALADERKEDEKCEGEEKKTKAGKWKNSDQQQEKEDKTQAQQAQKEQDQDSKMQEMSKRLAALKQKRRPTAADLLDKKEEAAETPAAAAPPKISVGNFRMSLGGDGPKNKKNLFGDSDSE
ncbi:hypothetical protein AAFC00_001561 [Neodothiora populina]|uniref:CID domain-containing protein n=1 Tax=Neodothiora populina TaxID=2781224 RepID=A0ABR3PQE0_9PEZI